MSPPAKLFDGLVFHSLIKSKNSDIYLLFREMYHSLMLLNLCAVYRLERVIQKALSDLFLLITARKTSTGGKLACEQ